MGVTIGSKNFNVDMGYGGFNLFRNKVAELSNPEFEKHYEKSYQAPAAFSQELELKRKAFFKKYDAETLNLIDKKVITVEIANFCYQCDCEGSINQEQAKQIYEKIKDYDDKICYGYSGRSDCAMFSDLKTIFKDCAENGGEVEWR